MSEQTNSALFRCCSYSAVIYSPLQDTVTALSSKKQSEVAQTNKNSSRSILVLHSNKIKSNKTTQRQHKQPQQRYRELYLPFKHKPAVQVHSWSHNHFQIMLKTHRKQENNKMS